MHERRSEDGGLQSGLTDICSLWRKEQTLAITLLKEVLMDAKSSRTYITE